MNDILSKLNPLFFFDYIYYRVAVFYKYTLHSYSYKGYALMFLSVNQGFNLILLIVLFINNKIPTQGSIWILIGIITVIFNTIRYYFYIDYSVLAEKWDNDSFDLKRLKGVGVILYIVSSILLPFIWK